MLTTKRIPLFRDRCRRHRSKFDANVAAIEAIRQLEEEGWFDRGWRDGFDKRTPGPGRGLQRAKGGTGVERGAARGI